MITLNVSFSFSPMPFRETRREPTRRPSETVRVTRVRLKYQAVHLLAEYYYRVTRMPSSPSRIVIREVRKGKKRKKGSGWKSPYVSPRISSKSVSRDTECQLRSFSFRTMTFHRRGREPVGRTINRVSISDEREHATWIPGEFPLNSRVSKQETLDLCIYLHRHASVSIHHHASLIDFDRIIAAVP